VKLPPENGVYATTAARPEPRAVACSFRRYRSISAYAERRLDQTGTAHDCELRNLACTNSRARVPCHQMPVWLSQGPLSQHRQERRSGVRWGRSPTCISSAADLRRPRGPFGHDRMPENRRKL